MAVQRVGTRLDGTGRNINYQDNIGEAGRDVVL